MSSNLGRIPLLTSELAALERLKKTSYNLVSTLAPSFLIGSCSYLQLTRTSIISQMSSNFSQIRPRTAELAALKRLKKIPYTYHGENLVSTQAPSFLIGSSSFLQVTRTTIKAWTSSNFGRIPPLTSELVALERMKKTSYNLVSTLAPAFLIESSSYLQITRTSIISQTSLNFSQILPRTAELAALERLRKTHRLIMGKILLAI